MIGSLALLTAGFSTGPVKRLRAEGRIVDVKLTSRDRVNRALEILHKPLVAYIVEFMSSRYGDAWIDEWVQQRKSKLPGGYLLNTRAVTEDPREALLIVSIRFEEKDAPDARVFAARVARAVRQVANIASHAGPLTDELADAAIHGMMGVARALDLQVRLSDFDALLGTAGSATRPDPHQADAAHNDVSGQQAPKPSDVKFVRKPTPNQAKPGVAKSPPCADPSTSILVLDIFEPGEPKHSAQYVINVPLVIGSGEESDITLGQAPGIEPVHCTLQADDAGFLWVQNAAIAGMVAGAFRLVEVDENRTVILPTELRMGDPSTTIKIRVETRKPT